MVVVRIYRGELHLQMTGFGRTCMILRLYLLAQIWNFNVFFLLYSNCKQNFFLYSFTIYFNEIWENFLLKVEWNIFGNVWNYLDLKIHFCAILDNNIKSLVSLTAALNYDVRSESFSWNNTLRWISLFVCNL